MRWQFSAGGRGRGEPGRNNFKAVNQYPVQGERLRRPDLLVFINGIPIAICEFKTPIEEGKTIHDAWEQIAKRYRRDIPQLMKYCFLSLISDGANTKMGSIFTPYPLYYAWNKADEQDRAANGIDSLTSMIKGAFAKERVTAILRDFIFYPDDSRNEVAIVCRYPQFFAANKMLQRIKTHMRPGGDGKGGTYFGATGCGKTYTMMYLSRLIMQRDNEKFRNPTIILLTDREDLNAQAAELFVRAKKFLGEQDVRSIGSRKDLARTLGNRPSGGVYITTIQKFCEKTGLLSERNNIICLSDEAHRTQTGVGAQLKRTGQGIYTTHGFAHYLRESFPNATYCGFTGTPVDETLSVFGGIVDRYTMKESSDDGITVRIAYEPRLARVVLSDEQAKEIQTYYDQCAAEGSTEAQIAASQRAMSRMSAILGHPDRIRKLAKDLVDHYEALRREKPEIVQKAIIVCADRQTAFKTLKAILALRPEWGKACGNAPGSGGSAGAETDKTIPLPTINLVATQGQNDEKELFELCGNRERRKLLSNQFKNNASPFKIAVVVDMWITGFDVPSLAVMYIDKPLQKHTLIQTISRVNRVFDGKEQGLVVDYIGIEKEMMEAVKLYGAPQESPIDRLKSTLDIFRDHLKLIAGLMSGFDDAKFRFGKPPERWTCLNAAAEHVQAGKERETRFMELTRKLKAAYGICFPSGELTEEETAQAQFYLAIRSIIYKQTKGDAPDAEVMNNIVEDMVRKAISCTGVENILDPQQGIDLSGEEFRRRLNAVNMPITKFNALRELLRRSIAEYGRINKVKAAEFDERLRSVVDAYNHRDAQAFTGEELFRFVDGLTEQILQIMIDLKEDKISFEGMGISPEEKAFYDILIRVRDEHGFSYADEKCIGLAKEIKKLVDEQSQFADWFARSNIKATLSMNLTILLSRSGYPPKWDDEVFGKVMEQAESFKKRSV
ncbi:MAG: HsdR family type I site-specific deoxyribonuclease [Akkermansiaceae bacterium]|nr:HsdR family type I site-specific deoxyribonuclease [Akkermansiaceae bacterium]